MWGAAVVNQVQESVADQEFGCTPRSLTEAGGAQHLHERSSARHDVHGLRVSP